MGARGRTGQTGERQPYRCFLIRCRLEEGAGPDGAAAWRFTVQQADANAPRRSFISLLEVAAHLEAELASCALGAGAHGPRSQEPTLSPKEKTP
jgi:hypothetical protein